jgi:hypothetical protein
LAAAHEGAIGSSRQFPECRLLDVIAPWGTLNISPWLSAAVSIKPEEPAKLRDLGARRDKGRKRFKNTNMLLEGPILGLNGRMAFE